MKKTIVLLLFIFVSTNYSVANDIENMLKENNTIISTVTSKDGYIDQKLHNTFWKNTNKIKQKQSYIKRIRSYKTIDILTDKILWKSILRTQELGKVTLSEESQILLGLIKSNADMPLYEEYMQKLKKAKRGENLKATLPSNIYNVALERLGILLDENWQEELQEYVFDKYLSLKWHAPFNANYNKFLGYSQNQYTFPIDAKSAIVVAYVNPPQGGEISLFHTHKMIEFVADTIKEKKSFTIKDEMFKEKDPSSFTILESTKDDLVLVVRAVAQLRRLVLLVSYADSTTKAMQNFKKLEENIEIKEVK